MWSRLRVLDYQRWRRGHLVQRGQVDPAGYPITLTAHQMGIVQKLAERWQVTTEQALGAALEVGIQRARHLLTEEQDHPD